MSGRWEWVRRMRDESYATGSVRALLLVLATYADERGECFPSQKTLAIVLGLSERGENGERHVRRLIGRAVELGELRVRSVGAGGRSTRYQLVEPDVAAKARTRTPESGTTRTYKSGTTRTPESGSDGSDPAETTRTYRSETPDLQVRNPGPTSPGKVHKDQKGADVAGSRSARRSSTPPKRDDRPAASDRQSNGADVLYLEDLFPRQEEPQ